MKKPNVAIELTLVDWLLEALSFLMLLTTLGIVVQNYADLPTMIPIHFNASGTADGFGGKSTILVLATSVVVTYALTTLAVRFPMLMNYPITITPENHIRQYLNAVKLMRAVKLLISAMFLYLVYQVVQNAHGNSVGLGGLFLPLVLISILATVAYYLYCGYKLR
jgi:uncharacterized membrane protein